jgi:hypothetical protein
LSGDLAQRVRFIILTANFAASGAELGRGMPQNTLNSSQYVHSRSLRRRVSRKNGSHLAAFSAFATLRPICRGRGRAAGLIDNQVGEDSVEQTRARC